MSNNLLNASNLTLEEYFINKQKQIEVQLKTIEAEDPVLADASLVEPSELGTDAWKAEAHAKMVVLRDHLLHLLEEVKIALLKLKNGTYGICEKCGKKIEAGRLQVMPTATACVFCRVLNS